MYQYQRIRIKIKAGFIENHLEEDYMEVVEREARMGWRFVQAFAPAMGGYGIARYVDLIFEREA